MWNTCVDCHCHTTSTRRTAAHCDTLQLWHAATHCNTLLCVMPYVCPTATREKPGSYESHNSTSCRHQHIACLWYQLWCCFNLRSTEFLLADQYVIGEIEFQLGSLGSNCDTLHVCWYHTVRALCSMSAYTVIVHTQSYVCVHIVMAWHRTDVFANTSLSLTAPL